LLLISRVCEGELVLLRLIPFRDGLLACELVVSSLKPAELFVAATRLAADCCSEPNALAIEPWDCAVTAACCAGLRPGLFRMF